MFRYYTTLHSCVKLKINADILSLVKVDLNVFNPFNKAIFYRPHYVECLVVLQVTLGLYVGFDKENEVTKMTYPLVS